MFVKNIYRLPHTIGADITFYPSGGMPQAKTIIVKYKLDIRKQFKNTIIMTSVFNIMRVLIIQI